MVMDGTVYREFFGIGWEMGVRGNVIGAVERNVCVDSIVFFSFFVEGF